MNCVSCVSHFFCVPGVYPKKVYQVRICVPLHAYPNACLFVLGHQATPLKLFSKPSSLICIGCVFVCIPKQFFFVYRVCTPLKKKIKIRVYPVETGYALEESLPGALLRGWRVEKGSKAVLSQEPSNYLWIG